MNEIITQSLFTFLSALIGILLGLWFKSAQFNDTVKKETKQIKIVFENEMTKLKESYSLELSKYYLELRISSYRVGNKLIHDFFDANIVNAQFGYYDYDLDIFVENLRKWYQNESLVMSDSTEQIIHNFLSRYDSDELNPAATNEKELFESSFGPIHSIYLSMKNDIQNPFKESVKT